MTKKILVTLLSLFILCGFVYMVRVYAAHSSSSEQYYRNDGFVFGTVYSIQYEASEDLLPAIEQTMNGVDSALSMFNSESVISRINRSEDVCTNAVFEEVFATAMEVSALSQGAFDITVAPLVNAWGFGFKNKQNMTPAIVDSLRSIVDYRRVSLANHRVEKEDSRIMMDASAIAKGYACDHVADALRRHGVRNLLVDIGGEVVAEGTNSKGKEWSIGITKPIDDPTGQLQELQDIIHSSQVCMASSGNYRNFYYEGSERRSHTIDPRSGYPVHHSLLSATVVASSCMRADALATACMVLGEDDAIRMISSIDDASCYLIVADGDSTRVLTSSSWHLTPQPK